MSPNCPFWVECVTLYSSGYPLLFPKIILPYYMWIIRKLFHERTNGNVAQSSDIAILHNTKTMHNLMRETPRVGRRHTARRRAGWKEDGANFKLHWIYLRKSDQEPIFVLICVYLLLFVRNTSYTTERICSGSQLLHNFKRAN